ncbi:MAG: G5 domain-containing protein [Oscillospiraceae bacterium]|jgi:uncharacterized protein YabE (DUF348 family)|nr:G5 domain-containing protein [Oscillospiraceae bacterium]
MFRISKYDLDFKKKVKKFTSLISMSAMFFASTLSANAIKLVVVNDEGNTVKTFLLPTEGPMNVLSRIGISTSENDCILVKDVENEVSISIERAVKIIVDVDDENKEIFTTRKSISEVLQDNKISFGKNDQIDIFVNDDYVTNAPLQGKPANNMMIKIKRFFAVELIDESVSQVVTMPAGTLENGLNFLGVRLGEFDECNFTLDNTIKEDMQIKIDRVNFKDDVRVEKVDFQTITKESEDMFEGETSVSKGVDGEKTITYSQRFVNGQFADETEISSKISKEAIDKIITKGTKKRNIIAPKSLFNEVVSNENNTFTGRVTAYTGKGFTANGSKVGEGGVAVNTKFIPLGSTIKIEGLEGVFTANDTGGALNGENGVLVDIYFPTRDQCIRFGSRRLKVTVLR